MIEVPNVLLRVHQYILDSDPIIEPCMTQGLSCIEAVPWIFVQHFCDKVFCLIGNLIPILWRILYLTTFILHQNLVDVLARESRASSEPII